MPIMNSFGALKQQRYSVATTNNWYSLVAFKNNVSGYSGNIGLIGETPVIYGYNGASNDFRPASTTFNDNLGSAALYKVYSDVTTFPYVNNTISFVCKDSSGNYYYFTNNGQINKYNSSNTFVSGTTIKSSVGSQIEFSGIVKGTGDDVYILILNSTDYILMKVSLTGLTVTWSVQISTITINNAYGVGNKSLYIDSADNLYVTIYTSSATRTTVFKFDTNGTLSWQKSTTALQGELPTKLAVDSSFNVFLFGKQSVSGGILIKLNSSGVFQSARDCTVIGASGTYDGMIINSENNITLLQDYQGGSTNVTSTCVMDTSYNIISSTTINQGAIQSNAFMYPKTMVSSAGKTYILCTMGSLATPTALTVVLKIPNNNTTYYTTVFSYSYTDDGGTSYSGNGTFTFVADTNPTLSSSTYTISTTTHTSASYTPTTATNSAPTLNSTVPYVMYGPLV